MGTRGRLTKDKGHDLRGRLQCNKKNSFYFRGSCVEAVKYYTYLGATFKHNLTNTYKWLKMQQQKLNLESYRNCLILRSTMLLLIRAKTI